MVVGRHALKNALLPVITVSGYQFGRLLGGTIIIESIFVIPGVGRYLIDAIIHRDFVVVQGVVLLAAAVVLLLNLIIDILYGILDPPDQVLVGCGRTGTSCALSPLFREECSYSWRIKPISAPKWPSRSERGCCNRPHPVLREVNRFTRRKPLGAIGGLLVLVLVVVALMAPVLAPYGARELPEGREGGSTVYIPPNSQFLLGTDHVGRDVLSRLIYGARISLYVGLGSVLIGITASFIIGVALAYAGGVIDMSAQRVVDALMALPGLIIALAHRSGAWLVAEQRDSGHRHRHDRPR